MARVPYANATGSLMCVMVCTRPYIAHAVGILSMYISKPRKEPWTTIRRVFRYLLGTSNYVICYEGRPGPHKEIHGFVDANWVGDLYCIRYTSGYVFNFFGGLSSWMSKGSIVATLLAT
jgi:hypothetical protein